jgi:TRAP-type C4-dicarboxylate transport system permease small subunit
MRKSIAGLAALLRASLIVAIALMLASVTFQVVMRYVFGKAPSWTEELAVLMFSWATLGALALGVHEGFHVRLDMLPKALGPAHRARLERAIEILAVALGAFLVWSGWRFVGFTSGAVSAAIGYPIELLHVLAPVAGGLICVFAAERAIFGAAAAGEQRPP